MRMNVLDWIRILEGLKKKGIHVVHRSFFEATYCGKRESLGIILNRLERRGLILRVMRNWFCIPPCDVWEVVKVVFPSAYISLEWALHFHDVLDQHVEVVTLVWLGKTKRVRSRFADFEIHKVSRDLYFGFDRNTMIAEPEKALLDTVYIRGKVPAEINIDLVDRGKLLKYAEKFPKRVLKEINRMFAV